MNAKIKELQEIAARFMKFGKQDKPAPEKQPEKFEAVKIKDGETMIEYDPTLEVGSPVMVSGGDGSTPAPDGSIELDNGVIFVVKDGLIESVTADGKTPDKPADAPEGFDAANFVPVADFNALKEAFEAFVAAQKTVTEGFSALPTADDIAGLTEGLQAVGKFIEDIANIPMEAESKEAVNVKLSKDEIFENAARGIFATQE